jgi:putative protein kinase ArgK-like GTPase of G3E family
VREQRHRDRNVGVIAIDPSSPFTGGAIQGDRFHMMELSSDPMVFIAAWHVVATWEALQPRPAMSWGYGYRG